MDLPINPSRGQASFETGLAEMEQTLLLLLKNGIHSFIQDPNLGSFVPEHTADNDLIRYGVERTLAEVPSVTIDDCIISRDDTIVNVILKVTYMNNKFTVDINI